MELMQWCKNEKRKNNLACHLPQLPHYKSEGIQGTSTYIAGGAE